MTEPQQTDKNLVFIKLGGSLITDKQKSRTPRLDVITRLAGELNEAAKQMPDTKFLLGHGSGSFGHVPASKYQTRQGINSKADWVGFSKVWYEASALNRIVIEAFYEAGLQVVSFPVSCAAITINGQVAEWNLYPIVKALHAGLVPVVFGDVVFDKQKGGTILSTEDIFSHLALVLQPRKIFLVGRDEAVWKDYPYCTIPIPEITPDTWDQIAPVIKGSSTTDVTGGMGNKVQIMVDLVNKMPGLEVQIFSGDEPDNLTAALKGLIFGTRLHGK